jgi:hypothetical protein
MHAIAPNMPPHTCPRLGRRRTTPSFFLQQAPTAHKKQQCWSARREATTIDKNASKVRRHED